MLACLAERWVGPVHCLGGVGGLGVFEGGCASADGKVDGLEGLLLRCLGVGVWVVVLLLMLVLMRMMLWLLLLWRLTRKLLCRRVRASIVGGRLIAA